MGLEVEKGLIINIAPRRNNLGHAPNHKPTNVISIQPYPLSLSRGKVQYLILNQNISLCNLYLNTLRAIATL